MTSFSIYMAKIIKIKVKERKLRDYHGYAYPERKDKLIEINSRLSDRTYLGTLIHEILHILYPEESETRIDINASTITHYVLKKGTWSKK